ncbi:hypothetical protein TPHA_0M00230 [Tetrapisispora phaffii CBS 4417]|uniref:Peptidase S8/S53 domain-containing protein n=1 Tax=Tetrapisispora phaffii (strain ATCC 24235 / CBS 4417 / NBRC 1672 / NRRL Y-8282 / UCD 70-5) TaxID=1071381 RepID=G8C0U0_TETPH|nr:hypothetical protein TPHA_0M00230 [Tetrapisispora phaffii CBS 4417]CCE65601.1 hypothetical protein TPHA_0M00230 [Tetrapisispora phaffii CBS 4417]
MLGGSVHSSARVSLSWPRYNYTTTIHNYHTQLYNMKLQNTLVSAVIAASVAEALVIPALDQGRGRGHALDHGPNNNNNVPAFMMRAAAAPASAMEMVKDVTDQILAYYQHASPASRGLELAALHDNGVGTADHDRYIIVFKKGVFKEQVDQHLKMMSALFRRLSEEQRPAAAPGASALRDGFDRVMDTFEVAGAFSGYIATVASPKIVDFIRLNPLVDYVEKDSVVHSLDETQNNAPWGLARISHREGLNLGNFNKYLYASNSAGKGVTAYVVDTGISVSHLEFGERAKWGKTIPINDYDIDGNGHGTHCAGTIGSEHYGVAKGANLVAVKVLRSDGSGTMSDVLKGVEWVALEHTKHLEESRKDKNSNYKGATANMSLGGGKSPALDQAVNAAVKAGVHFAVAAGNENQDACNSSPAAAENAITVGASTLSDDRAYFSNYGKCVDIFAPGLNILSTYIGTNDATATLSGTSMASPHVAGLLTYLLSLQPDKGSEFYVPNSELTPLQMKKKIIDYATKNALADLPADTPNKLIYNGGFNSTDFWASAAAPQSHKVKTNRYSLGSFLDSIQDSNNHWFNFDNMNIF